MSIPFVIRDDDLSAYTDTEKLKRLYRPIFNDGFKVSFGAIPQERETFHKGDQKKYYQTDITRPINENLSLLRYISPLVQSGQVEIMLHGYDHLYKRHGNQFIGECAHKPESQLRQQLQEGKNQLETSFKHKVVSFVPPSNQITAPGFRAVEAIGIRYFSGTAFPSFNRPLRFATMKNWMTCFFYFLSHRQRFPYVLKNKGIQEITYYALTPRVTVSELLTAFQYCQLHQAPFVLATHHWEFINHPQMRDTLEQFLSQVKNHVTPCLFKEVFSS